MPFFSVSLWLPHGSDRYTGIHTSAREAAKDALSQHEKSITQRLKGATGSYKRALEAAKIPRLIEVSDSSGYVVEKFRATEV